MCVVFVDAGRVPCGVHVVFSVSPLHGIPTCPNTIDCTNGSITRIVRCRRLWRHSSSSPPPVGIYSECHCIWRDYRSVQFSWPHPCR